MSASSRTPKGVGSDQRSARWLAKQLGPWFQRARRELSWRKTRDPYAIWVSEIMLQQTRVETVERYYSDFVRQFPDVGTLAAADEDRVLAAWSGLGYYRRARLLHRGAKYVHERLGGTLPSSAAELRSVPGIGRYTAGAIGAIAFDEPTPLVDGNVARVLSRLRAVEDPAAQDAGAREHWDLVARVLKHGRPRVLAQALMELGATVCTPRSPRCERCPLSSRCEASRRGLTDAIPAPKKRPAQPEERWCALAAVWRGRLLLVRRPDHGLLAKMWCLPLVKLARRGKRPRTPPPVDELLGTGAKFDEQPLPAVRHVFSHRIWDLHPWACSVARKPRLSASEALWIARGERPDGGVPSVTTKLLDRVEF